MLFSSTESEKLMSRPTYTKQDKALIDKKLRGLSEDELQSLTDQGAQILREKNRKKQQEYNAKYRQRIAMAAQLGLLDQGETK